MQLKRKLRTCRIQIQVEKVCIFEKKQVFEFFSIFFPKGLWCQNGKFSFFNFFQFCISFFKISFTRINGILKWTKSWILVTLVIKLWKWETALGCPGPKWPPSVGIGLSIGWRIDNCRISLLDRWNSIHSKFKWAFSKGYFDISKTVWLRDVKNWEHFC